MVPMYSSFIYKRDYSAWNNSWYCVWVWACAVFGTFNCSKVFHCLCFDGWQKRAIQALLTSWAFSSQTQTVIYRENTRMKDNYQGWHLLFRLNISRWIPFDSPTLTWQKTDSLWEEMMGLCVVVTLVLSFSHSINRPHKGIKADHF